MPSQITVDRPTKTRSRKPLAPSSAQPAQAQATPALLQRLAAQGERLDALLASGFSVIVDAPTGSGKTHRAAERMRRVAESGARAIYVCPTRALASQCYARWQQAWPHVRTGLYIGESAGSGASALAMADAQVLVMTAERLDSVTRQWRRHWRWLPEVDVIVVDEWHLLGEGERGARLEGAIMRAREVNPFVQIVGLSATLGNPQEQADWLDGVCHRQRERPVALTWRTLVFKRAADKIDLLMQAVEPVLATDAMALVFVQSRRRAQTLATELRERGVDAHWHHAGLTQAQRDDLEQRCRDRQVRVLVATSTLEMGMNFAVRLVVLYDLQRYDGQGYTPLTTVSVWQRGGRAGRPGLDETGEVVMLRARWESDQRYERGVFEPVVSGLGQGRRLAEQSVIAVGCGYARTRSQLAQYFARSLAARQGKLAGVDEAIANMCRAGLMHETDAAPGSPARLAATPLGRVCARQQVGPGSVLAMRRLLAPLPALAYFDILLIAVSVEDCDARLIVDFEEIAALSAALSRRRSALMAEPVGPSLPHTLGLAPKATLAAIKAALVLAEWIDTGCEQTAAQALSCYPSEVTRLRESAARMLAVMQDVLGVLSAEDPDTSLGAKALAAKTARLELMVRAGLDEDASTLTLVQGIGSVWARRLAGADIRSVEDLAQAEAAELASLAGLSQQRAAAWIDAASDAMKADAMWSHADSAPRVRVALQAEGVGADGKAGANPAAALAVADIDVYRLARSRSLTVADLPEGDGSAQVWAVSGGSEPHRVGRAASAWTCDCRDRAEDHTCKHILAVRRHLGERAVASACESLDEPDAPLGAINLSQWWF